jgi:hypothetical protein
MLLHKDLLFEVDAVAHFHEFVGVAGITVFAGELASAVGIDCPSKGHANAGAPVEQRTDGKGEVFNLVPLTHGFPQRSQAGDAYEFGLGFGKEGQGSHDGIRVLFAYNTLARNDSQVGAGKCSLLDYLHKGDKNRASVGRSNREF